MDKQVIDELKSINSNLEQLIDYEDMNLLTTTRIHESLVTERVGINDEELPYKTSYSYYSLNVLVMIFGFLIGYFLVKSFFDGYKI